MPFHQGYTDDTVYRVGEEDEVCRRNYIGFMVKGSSTNEDFMVHRMEKGISLKFPFVPFLKI